MYVDGSEQQQDGGLSVAAPVILSLLGITAAILLSVLSYQLYGAYHFKMKRGWPTVSTKVCLEPPQGVKGFLKYFERNYIGEIGEEGEGAYHCWHCPGENWSTNMWSTFTSHTVEHSQVININN